ncbi:P-selectin glycoprotein ligand 1 [Colius striatus]|uniref:P-selectin glycoprotein ligand 1 n=1 Tax=Colius striatus TaxID=57412 RepID=UPI002B1E7259|nr:P-selectin glycoprotein ligand 1 [Colius striatus]
MALGRAVLVLVLSSLCVSGAVLPEPGQHRGARWVWGTAQDEPPLLARRRRADGGQQPGATTSIAPGHSHITSATNNTDSPEPDLLLGSAPAPSTNSSLHRALAAPTTADPGDETDSPEPDLLLSSAPAPSTTSSLHRALAAPTPADPGDETDSPEPDLLLSSAPAPSTNASLHRALAVPTTTNPLHETDSPEPDLLLSSVPAPSTTSSLHRALAVPTTTDPQDETDAPELLLSSAAAEPGTRAARGVSSVPSWRGEEGTAYPPPAPSPSGHRDASPAPTPSAPRDTRPGGTAVPVPWDPGKVLSKCVLAILLLGLAAAAFLACAGALAARLWRRARTGRRRLSRTEMVCISSLLPDGDAAANGPGPARRHRRLLDGGPEADGDTLTLSSFLPEHS